MFNKGAMDFLIELGCKVFDHNFEAVGIGGSYCEQECPRDYDIIIIIKKIEVSKMMEYINSARDALGKKVDINIFTPLMWQQKMYGDKVATMLYKGVVWSDHRLVTIGIEDLPNYILNDSLCEILQKFLRELAEGKRTETRVIDLLIQHLVILRGDYVCL